jgi:hypothetical protein
VEAGGCPDATSYVFTEGVFDFSTVRDTTSLDPSFTQECALIFQSPSGTVLSFDWTTFDWGAPGSGESVKVFPIGEIVDGAVANAWDPLYGTALPPRTNFSGNTARIEVILNVNSSSTFSIWVSHNANRLTFNLPENPAFALGSDISIDYELHMARAAVNDREDLGWIGLYANGTCEDGFTAHECHLATRSVERTVGKVSFHWPDYKTTGAGWYSLRYFAGVHGGTKCEDPGIVARTPVTEVSQTLVMRVFEEPTGRGNYTGYEDDADKFNSGVYQSVYALAYAQSINIASAGAYLSGCSVAVTATANRRGYVNLNFVATASSSAPSVLTTGVPDGPAFRTNLAMVSANQPSRVVDIADVVTILDASVDYIDEVSTWTTVHECAFEPLTTAEIYISTERSVFTPGTLAQQLPGYELHLTY